MVLCCVIKGNIFFFVLLSLFSRDLFLSLKLTSKRCFSKNSFGYSLFFRRVLKLCTFLLNVDCDEFVLRRRSASHFMNPFFKLLKVLCLFVMRLHIEGGVSVESLAFVHFCVQECNF